MSTAIRMSIAAVCILVVCGAAALRAQSADDMAKISVSGEAVVEAVPDKIIVTLGIETWDNEIAVAKQKNNDIVKKALAVASQCGIPAKDMQTDHLSIEPRYKDDYRKENFLGYFVRNTVVLTLRDAGRVEELVTKLLEAGVNYIHDIDFQTTEFKKFREQARVLALQAAREKAVAMAAVYGQSIGVPLQITENYSGSPWGYYSSWGYGRSQGMSQNVMQNAGGDAAEPAGSIALGKISIRASVSVTFALLPR